MPSSDIQIAPANPPPPEPYLPHSKNLLTILAVALLVTIYTITALLFSFWPFQRSAVAPTTEATPTISIDPAAGWQTYRNEKYGFEFKYPQDWTIEPKDVKNTNTLVAIRGNSSDSNVLSVTILNSKFDPKNIIDMYGKQANDRSTSLEINGKIWYKTDYIPACDNTYELGVADNTILVYFYCDTANIDQILGTFKFTASTSQLDTSGWNIYKNNQFNFQFQYPRNAIVEPVTYLASPATLNRPSLYLSLKLGRIRVLQINANPADHGFCEGSDKSQQTTITIDNKKITGLTCYYGEQASEFYNLSTNGQNFEILFDYYPGSQDSSRGLAVDILSTFEFAK